MATTEPLLEDLKLEASEMWDELRGLADARWELAQIEARLAAKQVRGFAVLATASVLAILVSLPILLVALAMTLDGVAGMSHEQWLGLMGGILLLGGLIALVLGWLRFRRQFDGFARTLAEFREDMTWLEEKRKSLRN